MTAVWNRQNTTTQVVQASRYAGGGWTTPADLSDPQQSATIAQVVADGPGTATAAWYRSNGTNLIVQATRYSGGDWSIPTDLSAPGQSAGPPRLATDPRGVVTAIWYRSDGATKVVQSTRDEPAPTCVRNVCSVTGTLPQGATRVVQIARRQTNATRARAKCSITARGRSRDFTCTVRLGAGRWTLTTQALRGSTVVADSAMRLRVGSGTAG